MEINYTMILVAAIVQFVLGGLWYSPLMFGTWWMQIMGVGHLSKEELAKMQKEMLPAYVVQFVTAVVSVFVLAHFINMGKVADPTFSSYQLAFWIWLGFILVTQIGGTMWSQTKKKFWVKQIFVSGAYQLVAIMIATFILTM